MINRTTFVKPAVFDKFARAAFANLMCDLGSFANMSANTHGLLCHGALYIKTAQDDYNVALGDFSENSIEMATRLCFKVG